MRWDAVHDGRSVFLSCMRALCSPGTPIELPHPPAVGQCAELDGAGAVLLALLDRGLSLGVSGSDAARQLAATVCDATGSLLADVGEADWVLVYGPAADAISGARRGTRITPESGATLVIAATGDAVPMVLSGPGIPGSVTAYLPLDALALRAFAAANSASPAGVDVLLVTAGCLIGLPRSVVIHGAP